VVNVSRDDAVAFCRWASEVTRHAVRLPTEAEWEEAAPGEGARLTSVDQQTQLHKRPAQLADLRGAHLHQRRAEPFPKIAADPWRAQQGLQ
jgi:formylglycine-generating enzyme required for sulfatase activity